MAHQKQKQSTGSWKKNRDRHQQTNPKGPRTKPKNKIVGDKKSRKSK